MKMTMRKLLAVLATLAILCTVLPLGALFSAVADGDNLFVNGDFETGTADGWRTWQGTEIIADAAHNGGYGAHLVGNGGWGGMLDQTISVTAGAQYKLSFWINVNAVGANVQVKDGAGNGIEGAGGWFDANKKDKLVEWTFTATDDTVFVNFCGGGTGSAEDLYVDDFTLVALGGGSAPAEPSNDGYIVNGDFETGNIAPWDNLWGSCPKAEAIEGGKDSAYALSVVSGQWKHVRQANIAVEANTDYKITVWAKDTNNMCLLVKNGADTKDIANVGVNAGAEWTEFVVEFNSGEFTSIIFSLMGGEGTDQYGTFDNIVMEKIGGGSTPVEPSGDNVIANGDFAENIDGWYASGGTAIEWQDGALHATYGDDWGFIGYNVNVKANTDYVLTFKAKSINGGSVTPKMNKTDWSGTVVELPCEFGADWADYTWEFNSGDYTAFMLFFQSGHPATDGQQIWLDDVALAEKVGGGDTPVDPPVVPDPPVAPLDGLLTEDFADALSEAWDLTTAGTSGIVDGAMKIEGNAYEEILTSPVIALKEGVTYTVSFDLKLINKGEINFQVKNCYEDNAGKGANLVLQYINDASVDSWKTYSYSFKAEGLERYFASLLFVNHANTDFYLDNVVVTSDEEPVVPSGDVLNANFDSGEFDGLNSTSDISIDDGALKFNVTKDWGNVYFEGLNAEQNTDYVVSFKAKSALGKSFWVKFNDSWASDVDSADLGTSKSWKDYSFTLNSGSFGTLVFLIQFAGTAAEGETLWIDDLSITKVGGSAPTPDVPAVGSVLVNGDFEDGSNGWELSSAASIVDDAHNGNGALQLENPGMWSGAAVQNVAVKPNTDYVIKMWVKRVQGTSPFNLYMMDAADNRNLEVVKGQNWFNTADKDWTEKTIEINTGAATEIVIKWSSEAANAGIILIDDMTIAEKNAPAPSAGLVVNGDFETGDATGWETWQSTTVSEEAAKNGKYGVNLIGNGEWGGLLNQSFKVENGETYTITLWVCVNASGANLQIKGADKVEGECDNTYLDSKELSGWTLRTFNVVANSDEMTLNFCGGGTGKAEDLYIDDIVVVKKGETPPVDETYPIKNAGFETGDLGAWKNLWDACTYTFETPGHDKSNYAISIEAPGAWQQIRQDGVPVEPNTDYTVVAYVKNPINYNLVVKTGDDSANITDFGIANDMSNKWIRLEVPFNSGAETEVCVLLIGNDQGPSSALFDNVQIYKKGEEPAEPEPDAPVTEGPIALDSFGVAINRPVSADKNLILNGSFEEAEGGQWQSILGDTLYVVDDETAPNGNKSLYFNTTGVEADGKTIFYLDVEPETDYVFSVWVKGAFISDDNRFNATVGVTDWKDNFAVYSDHVFSNKNRQIVPTCWDNEWHLRSVQFNSGVNVKIGIGFAGGLSQMWLDDIALFKVDDGIKYADPRQIDYILASGVYAEDGFCAEKDNLIPNSTMDGAESEEFWSTSDGYKNGFLSFAENKYEYGTSLKYVESSNACNTYAIKWIEVKPHTDYTFSVDLRVVKEGYGKLALLDGKKRECYGFLMVDFDKTNYGSDWFTVAAEFNSGEFDRIGIAVVDGGGIALIDNMRLFETANRVANGVSEDYVKPPYAFGSTDDPHYVEGVTPDGPNSPDTGVSVVGAALAMALVPSSAIVAFKLRRKKEDEE